MEAYTKKEKEEIQGRIKNMFNPYPSEQKLIRPVDALSPEAIGPVDEIQIEMA